MDFSPHGFQYVILQYPNRRTAEAEDMTSRYCRIESTKLPPVEDIYVIVHSLSALLYRGSFVIGTEDESFGKDGMDQFLLGLYKEIFE